MKAAKSEFFLWMSGMKPFFASSASRRSLMRDLRRALHVDAAVVGRERVRRQALDRAARLDAADARAPAVHLERPVDVHRHGVGRVGPGVLAAVGARRCPPRSRTPRPGWSWRRRAARARKRGMVETEVARVFGLAQRAPAGVLGRREDLGQIARIRQLLPRLHLHQRRRRARDERRVDRRPRSSTSRPAARRRARCGRSSSRRPDSRRARRRAGRTLPRTAS